LQFIYTSRLKEGADVGMASSSAIRITPSSQVSDMYVCWAV
jgi:hypothetical protein